MGNDLQAPTTFSDGQQVNAAQFMAHVNDANIKYTAINARTLKTPMALTDEFLINDAGTLKKVTGQEIFNSIVPAGSIIQTEYAEYTDCTDINTVIPADDTVPQITEGTEIITLTITPRYSTSLILLSFAGASSVWNSSVGHVCAIFRNSIADAIASQITYSTGTNFNDTWTVYYQDSPATTGLTIYRVRVGPGLAGSLAMNGFAATTTRLLGGSQRAVLIAQEIKQ